MVVESCSGAEAVEMLKELVALLHEEAESVVVGIGKSSDMVVESCRGKEAVEILMLMVESHRGKEAVEMLKKLVAILHEEAESVVVGIGSSSDMVVESCRGKEAVVILMLVAD